MSDKDWESVLLSSLSQFRTSAPVSGPAPVEKLETVAAVSGGSLLIHFRNNISGITQKLGEIELKQDDREEIELFGWCGTAVQRGIEQEAEIQDLTAKYEEQSKTMEKLSQHLEDLVVAKRSHEGALLEKFRELLNTKKLKVRDQQRLLAGAKVDPTHATKVQNARAAPTANTPKASRGRKRKARGDVTASDSSEEDSFEPKIATQKDETDGSERADTPAASDDATEDESYDDLDSAPQSNALLGRAKDGEDEAVGNQEMEIDSLPPRRELPFGKLGVEGSKEPVTMTAGGTTSNLNQEAGNDDDETDDDDDEL